MKPRCTISSVGLEKSPAEKGLRCVIAAPTHPFRENALRKKALALAIFLRGYGFTADLNERTKAFF